MWDDFSLENWSLIQLELPGHGQEPFKHYDTIQELAKRIHEKLREEGIVIDAVLGHSMGGYVALELFKLLPDLSALILLNSNFWADSEQKIVDRKRVAELVYHQKKLFLETAIPNLFAHSTGNEKTIESLIEAANKMSAESIAGASLAMSKREDNTHFLKSETRPVLLLQGEEDKLIPLEVMKEKTFAWTEFVALPSGHMSMFECPEMTNQIIELFLTSID